MGEPLALLAGLEFVDDAGDPLVLRVPVEPHPATRRLMDTLGVRVEVGAVTPAMGSPGVPIYCPHAACRWSFDRAGSRGEGFLATHLRIVHKGVDPRLDAPPVAVVRRTAPVDIKQPSIAPAHVVEPRTEVAKVDTQKAAKPSGYWTRERIIDAIQRWDREHGKAPGQMDWSRSGDYWPSQSNVAKVFGTWGAGIVAAGFEPRGPGARKPVLAEREPKAGETPPVRVESPAGTHGAVAGADPAVGGPVSPASVAADEPASRSANTDPSVRPFGLLMGDFADAWKAYTEAGARVTTVSEALRLHPEFRAAQEAGLL